MGINKKKLTKSNRQYLATIKQRLKTSCSTTIENAQLQGGNTAIE